MEPIESDIEKAAGIIIEEAGIIALSVDALNRKMNISKDKLLIYFKRDEDILKFLAQRLENEIQKLINNLVAIHHEPEKELVDLFKDLYDFFNCKLYFLELMFADIIHLNTSALAAIIIRVRNNIKNYLIKILEQGKETGVFNYHLNTSKEVDSVLNRFRFFMSDIPMTHKMIIDFKMFRENEE
jgi:AcrR family transcriptional regulator